MQPCVRRRRCDRLGEDAVEEAVEHVRRVHLTERSPADGRARVRIRRTTFVLVLRCAVSRSRRYPRARWARTCTESVTLLPYRERQSWTSDRLGVSPEWPSVEWSPSASEPSGGGVPSSPVRSGSVAAVRRFFLGGDATHSRPRCVHLSHGLARSHLILLSAQGTQDRRRTRELLRRELAVEGNT
jgi:hypothetical protein